MAKGLSAESITVAAAELIEQYGRSGFSMRLLADTMGVKTASLYNHIENMDTLLTEVCRYALRMQEDGELRAIAGKTGRGSRMGPGLGLPALCAAAPGAVLAGDGYRRGRAPRTG